MALIEICEEDYMNLKHCIERTGDSWVQFTDLWPFTIYHIIEEYERINGENKE